MPEKTYSAPLGGWNARDSLDAMPEKDAVEMVNLVPDTGAVRTRGGKALFITSLGGSVDTLISYSSATAKRLLAGVNGHIYNITSGTAVDLKSGLANNRWQYEHFNQKCVLCNGVDHELVYDGTTIVDLTITSGPTAGTLIGVCSFKNRAFYWEKNATKFWYAAAASFQGVFTAFDLEFVARKGGYVVQMITWTRDAGDGMDDLLVIVFSTGEMIVYQGDDPSNATRWAIVGRYQMGAPLSIRSHTKLASTEILVSRDGILAMDEAVNNERVQSDNTFGGKIVNAVQRAAQAYNANFGWDVLFYPAGNLLLINVPVSSVAAEQYVRNTNTGAWCRFTGWNAKSLTVYDDKLYYGNSSGSVYQADVGTSDDGAFIDYRCVSAYYKLGSRGLKTKLDSVTLVSSFQNPKAISVKAFADFRARDLPPVVDPVEQTAATWDTSDWDTDYWATPFNDPSSQNSRQSWKSVKAFGRAIAVVVRFRSKMQSPLLYSWTLIFDQAGVN